jgi:hypothetical protein
MKEVPHFGVVRWRLPFKNSEQPNRDVKSQTKMQTAPPMTMFHKHHPRSKFTPHEDDLLVRAIAQHGLSDWTQIAECLPGRNPRQCRDRWLNYLSPEVSNSPWSAQQELLLIQKHQECGPSWKYIASFFPGRTDVNIKSHWLLMQRRSRKVTAQCMILAKALEPTVHRMTELAPAPETRPLPLPVPLPLPIGVNPKAPSSVPSDDDWAFDTKWDIQESMLLGGEFGFGELF